MNINSDLLKVLQVASFLVKNHNYKFVSLEAKQDELWLASNDEVNYFSVIRISSSSIESLYFDKKRVLDISQKIKNVMRLKRNFLDIHIGTEEEISEDDFPISIIDHDKIYGFNISEHFPNINRCIHEVTDPNAEYHNVLSDLQLYQKQKIEQAKKMRKFKMNWTYGIIIFCIIIHLLILYFGTKYNDLISASIVFGAYYKAFVVLGKEYWRLLTTIFVHISTIHLLMNMLSLYYVGTMCEKMLGWKKYLVVMLLSGFVGSILTLLLQENTVAVGISGSIYGLLGAFFVYVYSQGLFANPIFRNQMINLLLINAFINFMPNVGVFAHLGGFITGLVLGLFFNDYFDKQLRINSLIALIIFILGIGYKSITINDIYPYYPGTDIKVFEILSDFNLDDYANNLNIKTFSYYKEVGVFNEKN